jgi:hypothetical protein
LREPILVTQILAGVAGWADELYIRSLVRLN